MSGEKETGSQIPHPPKWLDKLANRICAPHLREELMGDLHERFAIRANRFGKQKANSLYRREVLGLIRASIIKRKRPAYSSSPLFNLDMIRNYFKIGARVLAKNKGYSFIHLTGLSIGLWACMMVATVVIDSLSYDKQWTRTNDIYRIITVNKRGEGLFEREASSASVLAPELVKIYPEAETYSNLYVQDVHLNASGDDNNGVKTQVLNMDTTAWEMMDIKILAGNPRKYVSGNFNLIISESFRDKFFKGQDPVGKIIYDTPKYGAEPHSYLITGIMKDLPYNSHLRADVISLHKNKAEPFSMDGIVMFSQNYILMKPGTDMTKFSAKVNKWYERVIKSDRNSIEFQPITDIYLHSDFAQGQAIKGSARTIYIFSGVAILLLFIACINFVNLSTARSFARLKEAGVRRILSGSRYQLIMQILTETCLLFGVAILIATFFYHFSIRSVETFLGHRLIQTFTSSFDLAGAALAVVFLTCLLTGLYPAWLISGLKPCNSLRGVFTANSFGGQNWLRKGLVVAQFSISIVVLLATIVVRQQLSFMEHKDLGYDKNNLLSIDNVSWEGKSDAFKSELLRIPGVTNVALAQWLPTQGGGFMIRNVEDPSNPKNKVKVWYISGDVDLPQTLGFKLLKGRLFDKKFGTDAINSDSLQQANWKEYEEATKHQASLITASAAKILKVKNLDVEVKSSNTVPVGIIENFNNESLYEAIKPTIIIAQKSLQYGGVLIRIRPGTETKVTNAIQKLWKQFYTAKLLEINSIDDLLSKQYEAESRLQQLFVFFSSLTMFLSALGIFGLVVQASEQRSKEVGIRKVLGASVAGIVALLSKDFFQMVIIAIIIASPIAWYGIDKWLQNYPFRVDINWWIFFAAGISAILITFLTVSFQAIKAAIADPVKSLRNE